VSLERAVAQLKSNPGCQTVILISIWVETPVLVAQPRLA